MCSENISTTFILFTNQRLLQGSTVVYLTKGHNLRLYVQCSSVWARFVLYMHFSFLYKPNLAILYKPKICADETKWAAFPEHCVSRSVIC